MDPALFRAELDLRFFFHILEIFTAFIMLFFYDKYIFIYTYIFICTYYLHWHFDNCFPNYTFTKLCKISGLHKSLRKTNTHL